MSDLPGEYMSCVCNLIGHLIACLWSICTASLAATSQLFQLKHRSNLQASIHPRRPDTQCKSRIRSIFPLGAVDLRRCLWPNCQKHMSFAEDGSFKHKEPATAFVLFLPARACRICRPCGSRWHGRRAEVRGGGRGFGVGGSGSGVRGRGFGVGGRAVSRPSTFHGRECWSLFFTLFLTHQHQGWASDL